MEALTLDLSAIGGLTDEQLYRLCAANNEIRIERTANGELILMAPAGGESSSRSAGVVIQLGVWNQRTGLGIVFDSSGGFMLPNGAMRAPDAAWVARERWEALSDEQRKKFPPLCPDVIVEVMSELDRLHSAQEKMREWMDNGCRLGLLIDPQNEAVHIYRSATDIEVVNSFKATISGGDVLPGFVLQLAELL